MKPTLYFAPGASSMAPHEAGADFEARPISFYRNEQRETWHHAINPEAKVSTLVIDARALPDEKLFPAMWKAMLHPIASQFEKSTGQTH
jgi:glutathione S-transferase